MSDPLVLFIDDDAAVRRSFARAMERSGIHVVLANSGPLGLERLEAEPTRFGVVFADYHMPGMDGVSCLNQAASLAPWVTRVLVSGQLDVPKLARAVNSGSIFRIIVKPWDLASLLTATRQGLARARLALHNGQLLRSLKHRNLSLSQQVEQLENLVLERTNDTLAALTGAIELRGMEPRSQASRRAAIAGELAQAMQLSEEMQSDVRYAALLSGLGRIGIRDKLLQKRPPLSPEERAALSRSGEMAATLLDRVPFLRGAAEILRAEALAEAPATWRETPLGSRILAVTKRMDELSQGGLRLSPEGWSEVTQSLEAESGKSLDPRVVAALFSISSDAWYRLLAMHRSDDLDFDASDA